MPQHSFQKYTKGNSVASHNFKIEHLAWQITNLNEKFVEIVIINIIVCSSPPSYRHVLIAWREAKRASILLTNKEDFYVQIASYMNGLVIGSNVHACKIQDACRPLNYIFSYIKFLLIYVNQNVCFSLIFFKAPWTCFIMKVHDATPETLSNNP